MVPFKTEKGTSSSIRAGDAGVVATLRSVTDYIERMENGEFEPTGTLSVTHSV
jgi:hypothetical protein